MPYKNIEDRKAQVIRYRETHRKKICGISKKYHDKHHKDIARKQAIIREEIRRLMIQILGKTCVICGSEDNKPLYHEKHGKKHNPSNQYYYKKHMKDFVPMCRSCHRALHWLFKLDESAKKRFNQWLNLLSMEKPSEPLNSTVNQ